MIRRTSQWGRVAMGVGLLLCLFIGPSAKAADSPSDPRIQDVKEREVTKTKVGIDYEEEENYQLEKKSAAKVDPIAGEKIKITSIILKPPAGNWSFKTFPDDASNFVEVVVGLGQNSDIITQDAQNIQFWGTAPKDTADSWPVKAEGNLLPPPGGQGTLPHWSAKVAKEAKAYAANDWWIVWLGHAADMQGLIDDLGYITLKEEPPLKASSIAAAPGRLVWYSLSDGGVDETGKFVCLCFGWTGNDLLYPANLPADLHYTLVFLNACKSASGDGIAFANKFGTDAYVGWEETIANTVAVNFAKTFMGALKGRKTVQQAVQAGIDSFDGSPFHQIVADNIKILRGPNVIVDLSSN